MVNKTDNSWEKKIYRKGENKIKFLLLVKIIIQN